jgi:cyclohexanone monooxygenase
LPALDPDYTLGCRRILVSDDYYKTLNLPNVRLVTDSISQITTKGIRLNSGETVPVDVLIFATGFDTKNQMSGLDIRGINGANIQDWNAHKRAYNGLIIENMPNAFFLLGPNTFLAHASLFQMIEAQIDYVVNFINDMSGDGYAVVKPAVMTAYNDRLSKQFEGSVFTTGCTAWYGQGQEGESGGRISTIWPFTVAQYSKQMRRVNFTDFDIVTPP